MSRSARSKDLLSTLANQLWKVVSGPLMLLLIPIYLLQVEQGYWYLFISLAALATFADLGFANLVLQFAAHEYASLSSDERGALRGDAESLLRLGTLLRYAARWIVQICAGVFPMIYLVGLYFLHRDGAMQQYLLIWTLYLLGAFLNFAGYMLLSFLEGLNRVSVTNAIRLVSAIVATATTALILVVGGGVLALALGTLVNGASLLLLAGRRFHRVLDQLLNVSRGQAHNWTREIRGLFNRTALSFSSGYFIFSIYVPTMHYFHGPVESGKVGLTLALVTSVFGLANVWMVAVIPQLNIYVSMNDRTALDRLFQARFWRSCVTYLVLMSLAFAALHVFAQEAFVGKLVTRLAAPAAIATLAACYLLQLLVNSWATYVRAHKEEPFTTPSLLQALWVVPATLVIAATLSTNYFFLGLLSSYLWWLPAAYLIFDRRRSAAYASR